VDLYFLEVLFHLKFRSFHPILNYPEVLEVLEDQSHLEVLEVLVDLEGQLRLMYLQFRSIQKFH
jgi:hypothetical protein